MCPPQGSFRSLVVGRNADVADLCIRHLEHQDLAQVGPAHLRIYHNAYDGRYYASTLPSGRSSGTYLLLGRGMVGGHRSHVLTPGDTFRIGRTQMLVMACKAKGRGTRFGDVRRQDRRSDALMGFEREVHSTPAFTSHFQIQEGTQNGSGESKQGSSALHHENSSVGMGGKAVLSEQEQRWGRRPMENSVSSLRAVQNAYLCLVLPLPHAYCMSSHARICLLYTLLGLLASSALYYPGGPHGASQWAPISAFGVPVHDRIVCGCDHFPKRPAA